MTTNTMNPPKEVNNTSIKRTKTDYAILMHQLGEKFAERAVKHDLESSFVEDNYKELKEHQLMSALIPTELGGLGLSHQEVGNMLRIIAHYCGSTSLAFAMHQHLVSAAVWKYTHKGVGEETLRKIADKQLVLISTGARDWLGSNGEMKKVEGGYLVSARKHFASQSVFGDVAITSAPYQNENGDWKVLHFSVPMVSKGVSLANDWDVLGMRATGSHAIFFDDVFIPEEGIALERNRDEFHPVWNLVLTVALPLISSTYVGLAERTLQIAVEKGKKYERNQPNMKYILGKLHNALISAQVQLKEMYRLCDNFNFELEQDNSVAMLSMKTNIADACIDAVRGAMEAIGGQSFYRSNELERIFRDVQASQFHPLPKWEQYAFTGEKLLS